MSNTVLTERKEAALPLSLSKVQKIYRTGPRKKGGVEAVKSMDLDIRPGELITLLGPSGCGKTTTLRMIAGLETITSGEILIGGVRVNDLPPAKRNVGVGFESYALYPPLSVRENLAYGLKARKVNDAMQQVDELARRLDMTDMLEERPAALSSGQKQRVSLARALIRKPPVLLLDEPLGHLDAAQRQRVRRELKLLQREFGYTTIVVTHDQSEAMTLSDRMAVMDAGIIQQFGTPDEIFDDPANLFVADFVGEPAINLLDGTVVIDGGKVLVNVAGGVLETSVTSAKDGQKVTVGVRPQDAFLAPGVKGTVFVYEDLMEYGLVRLDVHGTDKRVVVQTAAGVELRSGDVAEFNVSSHRVYLFDPQDGARIR
ncbi:MAG: ABC transporter ATP-binding protein [Propionibacteriaceae bacterium]